MAFIKNTLKEYAACVVKADNSVQTVTIKAYSIAAATLKLIQLGYKQVRWII